MADEADDVDLAKSALNRARATAKASPTSGKKKQGNKAAVGSRDPQPVDRVLQAWIAEQGFEHEAASGGLVALWADIVGPELADHVSPETITQTDKGRELRLRAESTAWATQVRLLLPQVLARIRDKLGPGAVDLITVVGPTPPRRSSGPRRVPGPGPRDTYG